MFVETAEHLGLDPFELFSEGDVEPERPVDGVMGPIGDGGSAIVVIEEPVEFGPQLVEARAHEVIAVGQRCVGRCGFGEHDAAIRHRLDHSRPFEVVRSGAGARSVAVDVHQDLRRREDVVLVPPEDEPGRGRRHWPIELEEPDVRAAAVQSRR